MPTCQSVCWEYLDITDTYVLKQNSHTGMLQGVMPSKNKTKFPPTKTLTEHFRNPMQVLNKTTQSLIPVFTFLYKPLIRLEYTSWNQSFPQQQQQTVLLAKVTQQASNTHAFLLISDTGGSVCVFYSLGGDGRRWKRSEGWAWGRWR